MNYLFGVNCFVFCVSASQVVRKAEIFKGVLELLPSSGAKFLFFNKNKVEFQSLAGINYGQMYVLAWSDLGYVALDYSVICS